MDIFKIREIREICAKITGIKYYYLRYPVKNHTPVPFSRCCA